MPPSRADPRRDAADPARLGRRLCPQRARRSIGLRRGPRRARRRPGERLLARFLRRIDPVRRARVRLFATRSAMRIDWVPMIAACASSDIVVSDRWLPRGCRPRWLKLDTDALRRTGGLAIYLGRKPWVDTVAARVGHHPWAQSRDDYASTGRGDHRRRRFNSAGSVPPAGPGSGFAAARSAEPRNDGSPGRAGSCCLRAERF